MTQPLTPWSTDSTTRPKNVIYRYDRRICVKSHPWITIWFYRHQRAYITGQQEPFYQTVHNRSLVRSEWKICDVSTVQHEAPTGQAVVLSEPHWGKQNESLLPLVYYTDADHATQDNGSVLALHVKVRSTSLQGEIIAQGHLANMEIRNGQGGPQETTSELNSQFLFHPSQKA